MSPLRLLLRGVPAAPRAARRITCPTGPRPPCRAAHPAPLPAVRHACRPPPTPRRPPCDCAPPAPPLDCTTASTRKNDKINNTVVGDAVTEKNISCGASRDVVAARLAVAEDARRRDYEREVRERRAAGSTEVTRAAGAAYRLGTARARLVATDGQQYEAVGALPPPGVPFTVLPPPGCRPAAPRPYCAHVPRVFLQMDRSAEDVHRSPPARPLTERTLHGLSPGPGAPCPRNTSRGAGDPPRLRCPPSPAGRTPPPRSTLDKLDTSNPSAPRRPSPYDSMTTS